MTRLLPLAFLLVTMATVAACSDGGGSPSPDASSDADAGLCAGKPCRTAITTEADWAAVAMAHADDDRCDFLEDSKFIAPATADAVLSDVVFQDVKAHRLHLDFMTQALPELFGGMTLAQYQQRVLRRAGRQYWAGALFRLSDEAGATIGYGFDVAVDPAWDEQLTEAEVARVAALLATRFHLPLVYAPVSADAIDRARGFTTLVPHLPRACQFVPCATEGVDCVEVPAALSVCGHFMEGRDIDVEYARKLRVAIPAGTVELPRTVGVHTVPALFGVGELGPTHAALTPAATTARYEIVQHPGFTQRIYTQRYQSPTGEVELRWEPQLPSTGGGFRFEEPFVTLYFGALLGPARSIDRDSFSQLGSCTATALEPWRLRGTLADGGRFGLDFRYAPPLAGSGPLFPTRGEVTLDGVTATVDDYFRVVYAGEHHNWNNQYWILFASPLTYRGHAVHGLWLDEQPTTSALDGAYTLDANHQPLDTLDVTSYVVERAP